MNRNSASDRRIHFTFQIPKLKMSSAASCFLYACCKGCAQTRVKLSAGFQGQKLAAVLGGGLAGAASLWTSEEETQALDSSLSPKLANTRKTVEKLLFEVVALEVPPYFLLNRSNRCEPAFQNGQFRCLACCQRF